MKRQFLYVEDEESDVFFLKYAFQEVGWGDPFHLVTDGQQAIEYLSGQGTYANRK